MFAAMSCSFNVPTTEKCVTGQTKHHIYT